MHIHRIQNNHSQGSLNHQSKGRKLSELIWAMTNSFALFACLFIWMIMIVVYEKWIVFCFVLTITMIHITITSFVLFVELKVLSMDLIYFLWISSAQTVQQQQLGDHFRKCLFKLVCESFFIPFLYFTFVSLAQLSFFLCGWLAGWLVVSVLCPFNGILLHFALFLSFVLSHLFATLTYGVYFILFIIWCLFCLTVVMFHFVVSGFDFFLCVSFTRVLCVFLSLLLEYI